ncbi:hypothetical protein RF11_08433 [Thelohanellus kitauei]|uniref:Uncharacterized protein n=1 Tax=Thelohanellus kitauei TaxID=669202 RepID=A0A0C2MCT1_THEKT|nr:hypothetical protein RF11_08433 [Thelohanellus kitauei]
MHHTEEKETCLPTQHIPTSINVPQQLCTKGSNLPEKIMKQAIKASKATQDEILRVKDNLLKLLTAATNSNTHNEFNERLSQFITETRRFAQNNGTVYFYEP